MTPPATFPSRKFSTGATFFIIKVCSFTWPQNFLPPQTSNKQQLSCFTACRMASTTRLFATMIIQHDEIAIQVCNHSFRDGQVSGAIALAGLRLRQTLKSLTSFILLAPFI